MKRTPRPGQYDHLFAAHEKAQALPNQPSMDEMKARIKTKPTPDLPGMTDILMAVAARQVRRWKGREDG